MKICIAAFTAAASIILTAPAAGASPLSYLQALNNHNIIVYDTAQALSTGWAICNALNHADGAEVAHWVFANTTWADVPTIQVAATWVIIAADELCPWQYHPAGRTA